MDRKLFTAGVLALGIAAQPATAQLAPFAQPLLPSAAKTEAILGGSSKLAALLVQQASPQSAGVEVAAYRPLSASVPQPASFGRSLLPSAAAAIPAQMLFRRAIVTDRPNVFGSVALRVERTPLDRRWQRVRHVSASGASAAWARALRDRSPADRVEAINRFVNARVTFVDDIRQYRTADVWQTASYTLRKGRGDCEDYAIAKLQLLRAAGLAANDLYLVIAKDLVRRSDHAVLVVRDGDRMLLLDNMTDRVTDATTAQDYRPILTYAAAGKSWTHGYRRETAPPVEMASAPSVVTASVALASLGAGALR